MLSNLQEALVKRGDKGENDRLKLIGCRRQYFCAICFDFIVCAVCVQTCVVWAIWVICVQICAIVVACAVYVV